jgi:Domain of unknown function (DUF4177)
MPYVSCPTCGERGKIPSGLIGVRIKCKQCGMSFQIAPPTAAKAVGAAATSSAGPSAAVEAHGIEVEGLDASAWTLPSDVAVALKVETSPVAHAPAASTSSAFAPDVPPSDGTREYKLLTPRDKFFDGRFDLARLEEALNHFGRQGWVAKSMLTPHVKGFTGALEETIIVLLERCIEST